MVAVREEAQAQRHHDSALEQSGIWLVSVLPAVAQTIGPLLTPFWVVHGLFQLRWNLAGTGRFLCVVSDVVRTVVCRVFGMEVAAPQIGSPGPFEPATR